MAMNGTKMFEEVIKAHLDKRAQEDELFAKSYANDKKSIAECCRYIIGEVKKSGRNGFADEEIFGLAVHYYDESDLGGIDAANKCIVVVNHDVALTEEDKKEAKKMALIEYKNRELAELKKREAEAQAKAKAKKQASTPIEQPTLF